MAGNTKQRILQHALTLFNHNGVLPTTTRDVAAAVGISHGNLCYHYPSREAMLVALLQQFAQARDADRLDFIDQEVVQQHTVRTCQRLQQYRFVSQEWAGLSRMHPQAAQFVQHYSQQRQAEWHHVLRYLQQNELLRDGLEATDRDELPKRLLFTEVCWLAFCPDDTPDAHAQAVLGTLHLALAKKARRQWERTVMV